MLSNVNLPPTPKIARFGAVMAIAMATGHLAQTLAAHEPARIAAISMIVPTNIVHLSADGATLPFHAEPTAVAVQAAPVCAVDLTLKPLPAGMIDVALRAPCRSGSRIVLRQAGLTVTGKVGLDGRLRVTLPALTADGLVVVRFGDGVRVEQAIAMPEVAQLRRFAVQWQGADAFVLHAFENGADYGQPGHIWRASPGDVLAAGGFVTVLGDGTVENPLLAEVYTYPKDTANQPGIVLEAAVLADTCGHDLLAEVLSSADGQVKITDLTLAMPDCSGIGDFLVLKNLAPDMKIATR